MLHEACGECSVRKQNANIWSPLSGQTVATVLSIRLGLSSQVVGAVLTVRDGEPLPPAESIGGCRIFGPYIGQLEACHDPLPAALAQQRRPETARYLARGRLTVVRANAH